MEHELDTYGFIIPSKKLLMAIASNVCADVTEEAWEEDPDVFIQKLEETIGMESLYEFCGQTYPLTDDGKDDMREGCTAYDNDILYFVALERRPLLCEVAYKNVNEAAAEVRFRIGKYLPEWCDIRKHICHITGSYLIPC